jgi:hypothetical protein
MENKEMSKWTHLYQYSSDDVQQKVPLDLRFRSDEQKKVKGVKCVEQKAL